MKDFKEFIKEAVRAPMSFKADITKAMDHLDPIEDYDSFFDYREALALELIGKNNYAKAAYEKKHDKLIKGWIDDLDNKTNTFKNRS